MVIYTIQQDLENRKCKEYIKLREYVSTVDFYTNTDTKMILLLLLQLLSSFLVVVVTTGIYISENWIKTTINQRYHSESNCLNLVLIVLTFEYRTIQIMKKECINFVHVCSRSGV